MFWKCFITDISRVFVSEISDKNWMWELVALERLFEMLPVFSVCFYSKKTRRKTLKKM